LADSGVIENVQSTSFEMAIGSSGTIESIEQMINHTAATSAGSQTLSNSNTLHEREFTIGDLGMVVKKVILKTFLKSAICIHQNFFCRFFGNLSYPFGICYDGMVGCQWFVGG